MNENISRKCYTSDINVYNWFKAHSAKYFISDTDIPKCLTTLAQNCFSTLYGTIYP